MNEQTSKQPQKHLYLIGGTMGVGKTTTCRILKEKLDRSVFLDGDWCWDMHPFTVNDETKAMVTDNICHQLNNFLHCSELEHIIFCWVMHEQSIIDSLLARLDLRGCAVHVVSLVCSEAALRARLQRDIEAGIRTKDVLERSIARLPLYALVKGTKLDVSDLTPSEAAETLCALCGGKNDGLRIVRVTANNYPRFTDMVFWRKNGTERTPVVETVPAAILKELQNENFWLYAAEKDGRFVGWISLIYLPKVGPWGGRGHVYVDELWVTPELRRQGIAKQLMQMADELARKLQTHGVRLYVNAENPSAQALYARCGFERTGTAYMMEKEIEA